MVYLQKSVIESVGYLSAGFSLKQLIYNINIGESLIFIFYNHKKNNYFQCISNHFPQMIPRQTLFFLVVILLLSASNIQAQLPNYTVANLPIFKRLANSGEAAKTIHIINRPLHQLLPIREKPFVSHPQTLIYHHKKMYALVAGTGIVYESAPFTPQDDSLYFKRLDSTKLIGYNIDCFNFFFKDSLYNLGGYGFWRWNGQLRKFNPAVREWNIEPLNIELPLFNESMHANIWYQQTANRIWALSSLEGNQALKSFNEDSEKQIDSVMVLDLANRNWELRGVLNPELANQLYKVSLICSRDSGLLVNRKGSIEYWNLVTNQVLLLRPTPYRQLLTAKLDYHYVWCNNNILFISLSDPGSRLDSIRILPGDFITTGKPIYTPATGWGGGYLYYWIAGLVFLIGGIAVVISGKINFQKKPESTFNLHRAAPAAQPASGELKSAYSKENIFTVIETALIRLILQNMDTRQQLTSIEEINRTLGIAHKSMDMQKRKRSDTITAINEKYMLYTGRTGAELIKRVRSELDGRMHEFYIPQEEIPVIQKILSAQPA